jgi:iron-sulfur cluster insertion protein
MSEIKSFTITDNAAARICVLQKKYPEKGNFLRIAVDGGGCSGFQYQYDFIQQPDGDDLHFEHQGAHILIDPISFELLNGSSFDYVVSLESALFVIKNPNASSQCGCGNSFSA